MKYGLFKHKSFFKLSIYLLALSTIVFFSGDIFNNNKSLGKEYKLDIWRGAVSIDFVGTNPVTLDVQGGAAGTVITQVSTEAYKNLTQLINKGEFSFHQYANSSELIVSSAGENGSTITKTLTKNLKNMTYITSNTGHKINYMTVPSKILSKMGLDKGQIISHTITGNRSSLVSLIGKINSAESIIYLPSKTKNTRTGKESQLKFRTEAYTSKAKSGVLILNAKLPDPPSAGSERERIARELGVTLREAQQLLDQYGELRINNAIEKATKFSSGRVNGPQVAGGMGSIANGIIPTKTLNDQLPIAKLQVYLEGPEYDGVLRDSTLYLRVFHPKTPQKISDLPSTISVQGADKKTDSAGIILMDEFTFNEECDCYQYEFKKDRWLIDVEILNPGPYVLNVDFSNARHLKLPITLTEDKKVIPRS